jgi:hypothetical protein
MQKSLRLPIKGGAWARVKQFTTFEASTDFRRFPVSLTFVNCASSFVACMFGDPFRFSDPPPTLGGQQHLESLAHASHEVGRRCLGLLQTSIGLCLGTFPLLRIRHNTLLTRLARHGLRRTRRRLYCLLEVEDDRHWQGSLVCSRYAARTASVGPACGSGRRRWWLTTTR